VVSVSKATKGTSANTGWFPASGRESGLAMTRPAYPPTGTGEVTSP
jgi:hypothetical protein